MQPSSLSTIGASRSFIAYVLRSTWRNPLRTLLVAATCVGLVYSHQLLQLHGGHKSSSSIVISFFSLAPILVLYLYIPLERAWASDRLGVSIGEKINWTDAIILCSPIWLLLLHIILIKLDLLTRNYLSSTIYADGVILSMFLCAAGIVFLRRMRRISGRASTQQPT